MDPDVILSLDLPTIERRPMDFLSRESLFGFLPFGGRNPPPTGRRLDRNEQAAGGSPVTVDGDQGQPQACATISSVALGLECRRL